jgi:hypothetical protein
MRGQCLTHVATFESYYWFLNGVQRIHKKDVLLNLLILLIRTLIESFNHM